MTLIGARRALLKSKVVVPGAKAAAFLARTSGLSTLEKNAVTTFINTLFDTNVTTPGLTGTLGSNTSAAYFLATNNATNAAFNVISTSYGLVVNGTMIFTPDVGYAGNGSTGYIDPFGLGPSTAPTQSQNSAGMTVLVQTNRTVSDTSCIMGADIAGSYSLLELLNGGNVQWDMNDAGTFPTVANTTTKGAWSANRTGVSATAINRNGSATALSTSTAASAAPVANDYYMFAFNSAGTAANWTTDQASVFGFHAGFNGADAAAWQNAANAGLAVLGINVY